MIIIQRLRFPTNLETAGLYFKGTIPDSQYTFSGKYFVEIKENETLSFNTYFNSFYENYYYNYTQITSAYLQFKIEGSFECSIYKENVGLKRKLLDQKKINSVSLKEPCKIKFPCYEDKNELGRLYIELKAISPNARFEEGWVLTDQKPIQDVDLAIIICTYKKEIFVKKTVDNILKDTELKRQQFHIFIVDNGQTLQKSEFDNDRVMLIPNRNLGGSGGFTRGLIEALEQERFTHFLLMDDDIEMETEAILRLYGFFMYANQDYPIAGSMLDLNKKNFLYEAGALYAIQDPFIAEPLKFMYYLEENLALNFQFIEENIDYGGFWFFALPREIIDKVKLPFPYFIKVDDMEYGLRIKEKGYKIIAPPAIAIWHDPFYVKPTLWHEYYMVRNHLITNSIHFDFSFLKVFKSLTKRFWYRLFTFEYAGCNLIIKAINDYLQGPEIFEKNPEGIHQEILEISKSKNNQDIELPTIENLYQIDRPSSLATSKLTKIIKLLLLNGYILPKFFFKKQPAYFNAIYHFDWSKVFLKEEVIIYNIYTGKSHKNKMEKFLGLKLLFRWLILGFKYFLIKKIVEGKWVQSKNVFNTVAFWKKYQDL